MMGDQIAALANKIQSLDADINAMHETLGVLMDDVTELKTVMLEVSSIRLAVTQMNARVRRLEEGNGRAA